MYKNKTHWVYYTHATVNRKEKYTVSVCDGIYESNVVTKWINFRCIVLLDGFLPIRFIRCLAAVDIPYKVAVRAGYIEVKDL